MTKNPTESELSAKVDTTNAEEEGTIEFILYEVWKHTKKSQVLIKWWKHKEFAWLPAKNMAADGIEIRRMRAHMDKFYSWEVEARKSPIDAVIERLGERLDKCKSKSLPKLHPIRQCFARLRRAPSENSVNIYVPLFLFNLEQLLLALAVSPIPDEQIPEEEYTTSELKQICRALVLFCEQQLALFEVPQMVSLPRKRKRSNLVAKKKKNKKRQLVAPDSNDNESQGDDTEYTIEVIITDEKNHSGNRVYVKWEDWEELTWEPVGPKGISPSGIAMRRHTAHMLQFNKWKEASQGDHYQEMIHRLLHLVHSQKQPALSLELSNLLTNLQQPPPSSLSEPSLLFLFNVYTWLNYVPPIKVVTIKDDGEEEVEEEDDLSYSDTHLQTLVRLTGHLAMS